MKKSFIKIICLLLSVMLMTSFVSCGGDTAENKVIINSFEVFDRDIQLLNVFNRFGRIIPSNGTFGLGMVVGIAFVLEDGLVA